MYARKVSPIELLDTWKVQKHRLPNVSSLALLWLKRQDPILTWQLMSWLLFVQVLKMRFNLLESDTFYLEKISGDFPLRKYETFVHFVAQKASFCVHYKIVFAFGLFYMFCAKKLQMSNKKVIKKRDQIRKIHACG